MQPFLSTLILQDSKINFKGNMIKRAAWGLLFLILSVLTLGYVFRMPLTQWFIAPTLSQSDIELHCLDWSINSDFNLHVERVCITYLDHQLELGGIVANSQKVSVHRANLRLSEDTFAGGSSDEKDTVTSAQLKKLALELPAKRPLLSIERLEVSHPQLSKPLITAIKEPTLNTFTLKGDINATIKASSELISGTLKVNDELLAKALPIEQIQLTGEHNFSFDGVSVDLNSTIKARYTKELDECPLTFNINGDVKTHYELNEKLLTLDASQLTSQIKVHESCFDLITNEQQRNYLSKQLSLDWQLSLPEKVTVNKQQLATDKVLLKAESNQTIVTAENVNIALNDPLNSAKGQLALVMQTDDINNLTLNGALEEGAVEGDYLLKMNTLPVFSPVSGEGFKSQGSFNIANVLTPLTGLIFNTQLSLDSANYIANENELKLKKYQAIFSANIDKAKKTQLQLDSKLDYVKFNDYQLTGATNQLTANTTLRVGELFIDLVSETELKQFKSDVVNLNNIRVSSKGLQSRALQASHHIFIDGVELFANHNVSAVAHPFEVIIPSQAMTKLNPLIQQFLPLVTLTDGTLNGQIKGDVNLQRADFTVQINKASGLYNDYLGDHFSSQLSGRYDSGELNVAPTTFTLLELRAGAIVKNISSEWQVNNTVPQLSNLQGEVMGGSFKLDKYRLFHTPQQALVTFNNIDASKVITLDDKSGITLTGRVNGTLPVHFNEQGVEVKAGELHNQGDGKLIIADNAAFNAVKAQQQELEPIIGLLENLDIQSLKSSVNLKPDGWLYLGVSLQGYNQAQKQQVNFNYNHEENVFTLLRALRLSDEITQKVEQQYSTKGSKND